MKKNELFFLNAFGIKIKKCCASCKYMQPDNKTRICLRGEGAVHPSSFCVDWLLRKGLENAGKGGGRVKDGQYLKYCIDTIDAIASNAQRRNQKDIMFKGKLLDNMRKEYRKTHDDIYIL